MGGGQGLDLSRQEQLAMLHLMLLFSAQFWFIGSVAVCIVALFFFEGGYLMIKKRSDKSIKMLIDTIFGGARKKIESDKWWWRNDDWFSTQLIIQLVTKKIRCTISSRFQIGFLQQMPPEIIVARSKHKKPEKPQKTLMCGTAPRIFPRSFFFRWNLYLKNNFYCW